MPIKAKRIDPSRARLAARGQWQKAPQKALGASGKDGIDKPSRSSSSSSTSSEESTVSRGARRSSRPSEKPKKPVPPAFLTTTGGSGDDDSDPELYRAARERTARFLYPNGRQPAVAPPRNDHREAPLDKTTSEATSVRTAAPSKSPTKEKEESSTTRIPIVRTEEDAVPKETRDSVLGFAREAPHGAHGGLSRGPSDEGPTHWVCPQPPAAVRDALAPAVDAEDFRRLLELLADDVGKARGPAPSLGDPLRAEKEEEDTIDKKEKDSEEVGFTRRYVRPARSFAELEEQAMLQLYDAASESQTYFIATEHTSEAFTIAAISAEKRNRHVDPAAEPPIPVSIVELDAAERTRRNAYAALQELQRRHSEGALVGDSFISNDALLSSNASVLAANAEQSLQRFLSCVHWIEVAMRNRRFIDEVGRFLYAHHRPFLQPTAGANNRAREFGHEAFTAYEQFSRSVSEYITTVLRYRVAGYSAEEFVLALYDPPPMNSGGEEEDNNAGGSSYPSGTMDVLSFHAWRLLQAVLSFEQFCAFMDEFITEEYGVDEGDDGAVESGGRGALSIRALLAKSRQRRTQQQQQQQQQQQMQQEEHQWESLSPVQLEGLPNPAPRLCSPTSLSDNTCASRESLVSAPTLQSRLPISHTPPPPPPPQQQQLSASHRGSRSSVASFPRRPDALPGRTLPPLEETSTVQPPRPTLTNAKEQGRGRSRSTKRTGVGSTSNGTGQKPKAPGNTKAKPV